MVLHTFAHALPEELTAEEQTAFRRFLFSFSAHLPCPRCRRHFDAFLSEHLRDDTLRTHASVVSFLHDAHNDVNVRLGKRVLTLEEHYHQYSLRERRDHTYLFGACAAVVACGVYYCYCNSRSRPR
jgi:hypothetical protein